MLPCNVKKSPNKSRASREEKETQTGSGGGGEKTKGYLNCKEKKIHQSNIRLKGRRDL